MLKQLGTIFRRERFNFLFEFRLSRRVELWGRRSPSLDWHAGDLSLQRGSAELEHSEMVRVFGLQRTQQDLKPRKFA
jgi:hypothetical protein